MEAYRHTVKYYETDRMGFTHHSNYVRWMEEARIDCMDALGWPYARFEQEGIISPVTAIECRFKQTTTFPEEVSIEVSVAEFKGVRLKLKYVMKNGEGKTVCEAASEHCFIRDGKIIRVDREYPEFFRALTCLQEPEEAKKPERSRRAEERAL